jgi:hypothetical protein
MLCEKWGTTFRTRRAWSWRSTCLACCLDDVEKGRPAHGVLRLETLQDGQMGENERHLRAIGREFQRQIGFRKR